MHNKCVTYCFWLPFATRKTWHICTGILLLIRPRCIICECFFLNFHVFQVFTLSQKKKLSTRFFFLVWKLVSLLTVRTLILVIIQQIKFWHFFINLFLELPSYPWYILLFKYAVSIKIVYVTRNYVVEIEIIVSNTDP